MDAGDRPTSDAQPVTRLAPSPTGALHLGNARTFLANYLMARQAGWRVLLRIDDVDSPRNVDGAAEQAVEDLAWLGIGWDGDVTYQSARRCEHRRQAQALIAAGGTYLDTRSRDEIAEAAGHRRGPDGAVVDPGTGRGTHATRQDAERTGRPVAVRLRVPDGAYAVEDGFAGRVRFDWRRDLGDFPLVAANGNVSYHLATVSDDAAAGVTHVVRGDDLLPSVPRQALLYDRLGLAAAAPRYWHLPLVIGSDGRKLAKRHGDTRLAALRANGVPAAAVLRVLAGWLGIDGGAASADGLVGRLDLSRVPRGPITYAGDEVTL